MKPLHALAVVIVCGMTCPVAPGQTGRWSSPVLGYVFDTQERAILTISGIPGAASIDQAIASASKLRLASVAPGKPFAVAEVLDAEGLVLLDWSSGDVQVREMAAGRSDGASVTFSRSGSSAAILSADKGLVQIWRGLPGAPQLVREIAGDFRAVAVSDDASISVGIQSDGAYILSADEPRRIVDGVFSAIALRPDRDEVALAENGSTRLTLIRGLAGEPVREFLGDEGTVTVEVAALAFTEDGTKLVCANRDSRSVTVLALREGAPASNIACDCEPTFLEPLKGNGVFRLSGAPGEAWSLLNADTTEASTFVIPTAGGGR